MTQKYEKIQNECMMMSIEMESENSKASEAKQATVKMVDKNIYTDAQSDIIPIISNNELFDLLQDDKKKRELKEYSTKQSTSILKKSPSIMEEKNKKKDKISRILVI